MYVIKHFYNTTTDRLIDFTQLIDGCVLYVYDPVHYQVSNVDMYVS